jgi:hypothetical protein
VGALHKYKSCDNILASLSGRIESSFLQPLLVSLSQSLFLQAYLATPLKGRITSLSFDDPHLERSSNDSMLNLKQLQEPFSGRMAKTLAEI